MESDTMTKRMPYALFSCLIQVLKAFIAGELELPLTAESLRNLGMAKWHIFPTKRTLEDMGWFKDGFPTPIFEQLARTYQSDHAAYLTTLKAFLQEDLYSEVFARISDAHIDLANASGTLIEEFFADYDPQGEARDMAYLFLALAREAGIIPNVKKVSHLSNGKFAAKSGQVSESKEGTPMDDLPQNSRNGRKTMHQDAKTVRIERQRQYVKELLDALPDEEGQDSEWWVDALKSNVDLLIKLFVRKGEDMKA